MVTDFNASRRRAPPLKRPSGTASATTPLAVAPAGITTLPALSTGSATVALNSSPELLIFELTALPSRTVIAVPAGSALSTAAAALAGAAPRRASAVPGLGVPVLGCAAFGCAAFGCSLGLL